MAKSGSSGPPPGERDDATVIRPGRRDDRTQIQPHDDSTVIRRTDDPTVVFGGAGAAKAGPTGIGDAKPKPPMAQPTADGAAAPPTPPPGAAGPSRAPTSRPSRPSGWVVHGHEGKAAARPAPPAGGRRLALIGAAGAVVGLAMVVAGVIWLHGGSPAGGLSRPVASAPPATAPAAVPAAPQAAPPAAKAEPTPAAPTTSAGSPPTTAPEPPAPEPPPPAAASSSPAPATTAAGPDNPPPAATAMAAPPATPAPRPVAPEPQAVAPIDQLNEALRHFECAALHGRIPAPGAAPLIKGTLPDPDEKAWLTAIAQRYFPNSQPQIDVDIVPAPLCRSLGELSTMRRFGLINESNLSLRLVSATPQLREGELIKVEIRAPAYPVNLRIDYYSLEGQVQHLWPNDQEKDPKLAANAGRVFGEPGGGRVWKAGGAPFGTEMITVIATPAALNLGERPWVEQSQDYLRDLKRALDRERSEKPNVYQTLLVTTRAR